MAAVVESGLTSVIVVAADSGPLLESSVAAALASSAPIEVILVDNASVDGEPERVSTAHAHDRRLRLLHHDQNLGFGPACNRAAAIARGDALLIVNPDCTIEPATIASLRAIAAQDSALGMLGLEIVAPGGEPARGNRRRDPTVRRALMTLSGLARLESRWPALAGVEMPVNPSARPVETVEAVSGACLFLPRHVFDEVGGFDEGYFLHVEDLDLCRRVRNAGYSVAIAHALRAVHAQGGSSRHRPLFVAWHKHRGMWRYFRKFDSAARNPAVSLLVWLGIWSHFLLTALFHLASGRSSSRGNRERSKKSGAASIR